MGMHLEKRPLPGPPQTGQAEGGYGPVSQQAALQTGASKPWGCLRLRVHDEDPRGGFVCMRAHVHVCWGSVLRGPLLQGGAGPSPVGGGQLAPLLFTSPQGGSLVQGGAPCRIRPSVPALTRAVSSGTLGKGRTGVRVRVEAGFCSEQQILGSR